MSDEGYEEDRGRGGVFGLGFLLVLTLSSCPNSMQMGLLDSVSKSVSDANEPPLEQVAPPRFNPAGPNTFNEATDVIITCSTPASTIYFSYTTDGNNRIPDDPNPDDPASFFGSGAGTGITVNVSGHGTVWTIKAVAVADGMSRSPVSISEKFTVDYSAASAPTFEPSPPLNGSPVVVDDVSGISVKVRNTNRESCYVRYTGNGPTPTPTVGTFSDASEFDVPIAVSGTTLRALAYGGPYSPSGVASATYALKADHPTLQPADGTYSSDQDVAIVNHCQGATVHYTTNNTNPTAGSPVLNSGQTIPVHGHGTSMIIRAIAIDSSGHIVDSDVVTATYSIQYEPVSSPVFTPPPEIFDRSVSVTISVPSPNGATIRYTLDGSTPSRTHGTTYSGAAINIAKGNAVVLKAIAYKDQYLDSVIASGTYDVPYAIGDVTPEGYFVFHVVTSYSGTGWRYLVAGPHDLYSDYAWGGYGEWTGASATGIGLGAINTNLILRVLSYGAGYECATFGSTYGEWWLPSRDELNLMYLNLKAKGGGGFTDGIYWSSSEVDVEGAWDQSFLDGVKYQGGKNGIHHVRPVKGY